MKFMNWVFLITGIVVCIIGVLLFILGSDDRGGVICFIFGIVTILWSIPTDNYTGWEQEPESAVILLVEDDQYVVDNGEEYIFKVKNYTATGDRTEEYRHFKKNENTFVEFVDIGKDETAFYVVFTRVNKSVIGLENDTTQTKYVFYIPK